MTRFNWTLALVLALGTAGVSAAVYPKLPERIPTHWNIKGEIDGYGEKTWAVFLMPAAMLGLLALFRVLPWLSPSKFTMDTFRSTFAFIVAVCMAFFAYIQGLLLWAGFGDALDISRMLLGGMCVMFVLLGNVMGKVKRNFYVGVRTPWTLASDRVWADTHRLAARLFVAAGVVGLVVCFASGQIVSTIVTITLVGLAGLTPVLYSLVHYKRLERRGEA
jgi:uncharacterized membrane protein